LNPPGVDIGIVDAQRGAVGIETGRGIAGSQLAARRHDPDVLDRAPLQRPAKMPFAGAAALAAVFGKLPDIEVPGADEAAIEIHLAGAVGCGAVRAEGVEKC
jgi:hypothetical protein